jgi:molybdenum cofactor biosynthesis enzyme MoaA
VASICDEKTIVVQMVAFSEPGTQLPRYLAAMNEAGLREVRISTAALGDSERIWRRVPNRKWYAEQRGNTASGSEVVLFHRKK